MVRVLFICHGNICRSPMAEFVLKDMVEKKGLQGRFHIESAATSTEEIWGGVGNPVYPPAQRELVKHGIGSSEYTDFRKKRARQVTKSDYEKFDYLLCADANNIRNTMRITGPDTQHKVRLMLDFAEIEALKGKNITDPWYSGNFEEAYGDVEAACRGLLNYLLTN